MLILLSSTCCSLAPSAKGSLEIKNLTLNAQFSGIIRARTFSKPCSISEDILSSSWPSELKLQKIESDNIAKEDDDEYYDDDDDWDDDYEDDDDDDDSKDEDDDDDDEDWLDDDEDEYDDEYYDDDEVSGGGNSLYNH
jgi:hypothetical protein